MIFPSFSWTTFGTTFRTTFRTTSWDHIWDLINATVCKGLRTYYKAFYVKRVEQYKF